MGFFSELIAAAKEGWNKGYNHEKNDDGKEWDVEENIQDEVIEEKIILPDFMCEKSIGWVRPIRPGKIYNSVYLIWKTCIECKTIKEYIVKNDKNDDLYKYAFELVKNDNSYVEYKEPKHIESFEVLCEWDNNCIPYNGYTEYISYKFLINRSNNNKIIYTSDISDVTTRYYKLICDVKVNGIEIIDTLDYGSRNRKKIKIKIYYDLIFNERINKELLINIPENNIYDKLNYQYRDIFEDLKEDLLIDYPDRGIDKDSIKILLHQPSDDVP